MTTNYKFKEIGIQLLESIVLVVKFKLNKWTIT